MPKNKKEEKVNTTKIPEQDIVVSNQQVKTFGQKMAVNLKAMKSLFKLFNANYWQSGFSPVMNFGFVIVFIAMYGFIMQSQSGDTTMGTAIFKSSLIGIIAMQTMSFAINTVPSTINDFRNSVLLKRIGTTPVRPWSFLLTAGLFYGALMFIEFFWCFMWIAIIFNKDIGSIFGADAPSSMGYFDPTNPLFDSSIGIAPFQGINWGGLICAVIYTVIVSIFIGLLVVSITRSVIGSNVIGMIIFFLSMFLSGQLFPIQNIVQNDVLNGISYLTPFRYTTTLLTISWNGGSIFNMSQPIYMANMLNSSDPIPVYQTYDLWLSWFIPVGIVAASLFFSAKNFKWGNR